MLALDLALSTSHAAIAVLAATAAYAQPVLAPGDRVRITTSEGEWTGTVLRVGSDSLHVAAGRPERVAPVAYGEWDALEVRRRRSRVRGAVIGALAGAGGVGVATLGLAAYTAEPESMAPGFILFFGGAIGVPAGAVLGAAVGALLPGGRWMPVEAGQVRLTPVALGDGGGGLRLQVRLSA